MKAMTFVGATVLMVVTGALAPSARCAEVNPYSELVMSSSEVSKKSKDLVADKSEYWQKYGKKVVDRKTGQVLAWSVDLVDRPRQGEAKMCRTRLDRWFDRTRLCRREGCISKDLGTVKHELYAASLLNKKASCKELRYPEDFFLAEANIGDQELSIVAHAALRFQSGPNGCGKISNIRRSSAKAATFDVSATCQNGSGWGEGTSMEIEISAGVGKVVANLPLTN